MGWILRIALCVFLPWRLLYGSKYLPLSLGPGFDFDLGGWSTGEAAAWCAGLGAALLIAWQLLRLGHSEEKLFEGNLRSVLVLVVAFGSVITMVGAKSLVLGQLFGVLTAAIAGCALGSALVGTHRGPDAAAGPLVILFGSLLMAGHFFAELTLTHAALLLGAMSFAGGWLPVPSSLLDPNENYRAGCFLLGFVGGSCGICRAGTQGSDTRSRKRARASRCAKSV